MKTLKILHIMSGYGGGISSFIYNKAFEMQKYNIQFDVITYDECPENFKKVIHSTGGKIYKMVNPKKVGWKKFVDYFTDPLKTNEYDIVHCHLAGLKVLPYYLLVRRYTKARFLIHAHSSYNFDSLSKSQKMKINIHQKTNRSCSELPLGCGEKAIHSHYGLSIPKNNMMVIPNSIDVKKFIKDSDGDYERNRQEVREKFGIAAHEMAIGHIGRLTNIKNHDLTINLAEKIKEDNRPMKVLIIGEGYRETELKTVVEKKQLNEVITFTGRISPIEDLYPALDVLLLPSFAEGLPTVVVEAQAGGVPVVMSDTITEEVDLGLDMLETVPLDADISEWIDAIQATHQRKFPNAELREKVIRENKFSNESSAELYAKFIRGDISQYTIGDA